MRLSEIAERLASMSMDLNSQGYKEQAEKLDEVVEEIFYEIFLTVENCDGNEEEEDALKL